MSQKEQRFTVWLFVLGGIVLIGACAAAFVLLRRGTADAKTARDMATLVQTNLGEAQRQFLNRWFQVEGVVRDSLLVADGDPPFTMVDLDTGHPLEFKAAFPQREQSELKPGMKIVFEGQCILCEPGVIYLERCEVISREHGKGDKK